ncbi:MAG TPA: effector binding domain-containing protein [Lachnospiraceae bacterium]|nr:effector binding domain-containing protein [Lachnospiraceae bacterium]
MDWLTKMNAAVDYIEDNLTGEIDLNVVCRKACCSSYNFQRMFSFITDIPLAEYIRRRRLTVAALDLQNSNLKVIDLALKYGYDSAASFARAFNALHGVTPSQARQPGVKLKAYPKISFQISIKGEKEMNYRIETKEAFDVFGIETIASLTGDEGYLSPPELWQQCHKDGEYERLMENAGDLPDFIPQDLCKIHAVENYRKTEANTFPYMLCAFVSRNSNTEGYKTVHIPAQTYAIFSSEKFSWGDDFFNVLTTMQKRFYGEWLPTANYERADAANFEIYGGTKDYGYIELWFPVKTKN